MDMERFPKPGWFWEMLLEKAAIFCNAGIEEADAPGEELTRAPAAHKAPVQIAGESAEEKIAAAADDVPYRPGKDGR
jgi:hypothetical protein